MISDQSFWFIHIRFYLIRDATLTVFVPPERPIIINGDVLSTNEDREVEIKCVSRGGKPEPTVSVTDGLLSRVAAVVKRPRKL